ncbi:hypothetical protein SBV1_2860018 [Verrucomicrobia bacterium]|nr:hypothetical protein SBV1_2860018 [Verrucomicrobiota bacterium]
MDNGQILRFQVVEQPPRFRLRRLFHFTGGAFWASRKRGGPQASGNFTGRGLEIQKRDWQKDAFGRKMKTPKNPLMVDVDAVSGDETSPSLTLHA